MRNTTRRKNTFSAAVVVDNDCDNDNDNDNDKV